LHFVTGLCAAEFQRFKTGGKLIVS